MKLAVIVGSTRQNRVTLKEAKWVVKTAQTVDGIEATLIDLVDYPLPFFDEPVSPRYSPERKIEPAVQKWLAAIEPFDAYVFVTPEYNHSITGVLKNAIDYITTELNRKPSAIVSHGSMGGARAAMHLKEILSESRSVVIPQAVPFLGIYEGIDEEGNLAEAMKSNPHHPGNHLVGLLEELKWYADALSAARNK